MRAIFRRLSIAILTVIALSAFAPANEPGTGAPKKIDINLTRMSGTMVYAQVYQMVTDPAKYVGKRIKMKGVFSSYYDEQEKRRFYGCVIADALACCSQGLAFELEKPRKFPEEFPDEGTGITIIGDFELETDEGGIKFPIIRNAKMSNE